MSWTCEASEMFLSLSVGVVHLHMRIPFISICIPVQQEKKLNYFLCPHLLVYKGSETGVFWQTAS